jgi:hypothetical protein
VSWDECRDEFILHYLKEQTWPLPKKVKSSSKNIPL